MAPLYKKALVIGATSGIGEALALKLAGEGTQVIATGRRQDRLAALQTRAGKGIKTLQQDITDLAAIPAFAARLQAEEADIDAFILNSGIQRMYDFTQPATLDLAALGQELTTNYLAYVHLVTALLPQLQARARAGKPTYLLFMSATIGLVPTLLTTPNYNASKAALHSFITVLRKQLADAGDMGELRIVEVFPPAVQTELHDEVHQPLLVNGGQIGMPLDQFTEVLYAKLQKDPRITVGVGPVEPWLAEGGFEYQRQQLFETLAPIVTGSLDSFLKKVRTRQDGPDRPRRIVGPQSALTDFLASRNISARQIEADFQERRRAAERQAAEEAAQQNSSYDVPTPTPTRSSARLAAATAATPGAAGTSDEASSPMTAEASASNGTPAAESTAEPDKQLSAPQQKVVEAIKRKRMKGKGKGKGKKGKGKNDDDDDDEEEELTLLALSNAAASALPGQMENCGACGKRFTVTAYSRADASGRLLCSTCSKKLDAEDDALRKTKQQKRARSSLGAGGGRATGPVGQRRKAQSRLLDGTSLVGAKPLVSLCVEHLSRNIHLAEDLGDLPEEVVDRIARMLAKRRLVNGQTVRLFVRATATDICIYDGALLCANDYMQVMQEMPRLQRLVVHNAIQVRDAVMQYLQTRDTHLSALCLYGANLVTEGAWKAYFVERGAALQTLHLCQTDKHVTDEVATYIRDCAPALRRLKIKGNQAMTGAGVDQLSQLEHLEHLGLDLMASMPSLTTQPIHADVFVRLIARRGAQLQTLSLRRASMADNSLLAALHEHCRQLRKLRLTDSSRVTDAGFVRLFSDWQNVPLRFADFERCRHDDPDQPASNDDRVGLCSDGFRALMAHSGIELQQLNICACRHIGREAFESVFAAGCVYPELRRIEASFCEEITDHVVSSMFRCCPNLREVATFGCMRVTGVGVPHGRIVVGVPNALGMQTVGQEDED